MLRAVREHVTRAGVQDAVSKLERRPGASGASFVDLGKIAKPPLTIRRLKPCKIESSERSHSASDAPLQLRRAGIKQLLSRDGKSLTFEDLRFESDVLAQADPGVPRSRLVDDTSRGQTIDLWIRLLEFRARIDGQKGVQDIWQGMQRRHLDLPTQGDEANVLWATFCESIPPAEIFAYAQALFKSRRESHDGLYTHIIKPLLGTDPQAALSWSRRLKKINISGRRSLTGMVEEAITTPKSLKIFRHMYIRQDWGSLYEELIPRLCERNMHDEALNWHRFLLSVDDVPARAVAGDRLWLFFQAQKDHQICQEILESFKHRKVSLKQSVMRRSSGAQVESRPSSRKDIIYVSGQSFGPTPAYITDEYASRAFATRMFGLDVITLWLTAFGIETLGPLAMRELAVRCNSSAELLDRIHKLQEKRVKVSDHVFCQIVQQVARTGDQALLDSVLQADLHPDVYGDLQTQRELLRSYAERKDLSQLRRTLFVLAHYHRVRADSVWNYLLYHHMQRQEWPMIQMISNEMIEHGVSWTSNSIKQSFFLLLPTRKAGKRPSMTAERSMENVVFVTRLWLQVLRAGGIVPPQSWRQVIIYFGMEGYMAELESLSLWLVHYYGKGQGRSTSKVSTAPSRLKPLGYVGSRSIHQRAKVRYAFTSDDPIKELFPPLRLRAIIEWAMKTLGRPIPASSRLQILEFPGMGNASRQDDSTQHWARGLRLLSVLHRRGVPINVNIVRKACVNRFRILFGGEVSREAENTIAVTRNPHTLADMVKEVNQIWHEPVFNVPIHVLRDEAALKRLVLGEPQGKIEAAPKARPANVAESATIKCI